MFTVVNHPERKEEKEEVQIGWLKQLLMQALHKKRCSCINNVAHFTFTFRAAEFLNRFPKLAV